MYTKEEVLEKLKIYQDDKFKFNADEHVYTYDNEVMRGCTTFLNRFVKEFDSAYWAEKKAQERGISAAEILAEWDEIRERSCYLGTLVHDYIENFYEKNITDLTPDDEANERIKHWHKIYESKLHIFESVGSEIRIFSKKYNIAGTIDKLYLYDGMLIIGDWKTNKKIKTDKDYSFGNTLLYPFEHLKENELNKYSLQLSMYALILEEIGLEVSSGFICHIPHNGECAIYKTKDLRADLKFYLNSQQLLVEDYSTADIEKIKKDTKLEVVW